MFQNKLFKIAYAISIAEGWYARKTRQNYPDGSASYINHNPGNLRSSTFEIGNTGQYSIFENDLVGYYAIVHQLYLYSSGHSNFVPPIATIANALARYTGLAESSPDFQTYIEIIEKMGGVARTDPISSILK